MVFAPAAYAYSLLPSSSRRSSVASTLSSVSSSRRSSLTGGALSTAFPGSSSPRRPRRAGSTPTAVLAGFLVALAYFSFQAWSDPTLHDFLAPPPAPDSEDFARLYRTFSPEPRPVARLAKAGVLPTPMYGDACLESWLGRGEPCVELGPGAGIELDAVISWVNGSDPLWYEQYAYYSSISNIPDGWGPAPIRHYREKDELRHALRALHANLGSRLRKIHIVLGDWASSAAVEVGSTSAQATDERTGQVPYWLEQTLLGVADEEGVSVVVHHHAEFFGDRTLAADDEAGHQVYLGHALPTFNSFAIESQLANLPGLAPHWVALNDDFFISQPHSPSDWYTPAYGPLLRLESPTGMYGQVSPEIESPPAACPHERSALLRSNWLLSQRFGSRGRVPVSHIPKVQSSAILAESAEIWAEDFRTSATRRFRETGETAESQVGDLHAIWLGALLLVERSREAMLWTWAVARIGGLDGVWTSASREKLARLLHLDLAVEARVATVPAFDPAERPTTTAPLLASNLAELGLPLPDASNVTFTSLDGPEPGRGAMSGPCTIDLDLCFGTAFWSTADLLVPAEDIFKRLAFEHPACGDCVLSAVIAASGPAGLSALLPPPRQSPASDDDDKGPEADGDVPHMPLTKDWRTTDFSVRAVVPNADAVNLRVWALRLIARYQYALGEQSHLFAQVIFPDDIYTIGSRLEREPVSTLVLNDDLDGTLGQQRRASDNIRAWLDEAWPTPAWWERGFEPDAADALGPIE